MQLVVKNMYISCFGQGLTIISMYTSLRVNRRMFDFTLSTYTHMPNTTTSRPIYYVYSNTNTWYRRLKQMLCFFSTQLPSAHRHNVRTFSPRALYSNFLYYYYYYFIILNIYFNPSYNILLLIYYDLMAGKMKGNSKYSDE